MISYPPKCSKKWTEAERLSIIGWICGIWKDRLDRDNPRMPAIAKQPTIELIKALKLISTGSRFQLEMNRDALEKPYDSSLDHLGVVIPKELEGELIRTATT